MVLSTIVLNLRSWTKMNKLHNFQFNFLTGCKYSWPTTVQTAAETVHTAVKLFENCWAVLSNSIGTADKTKYSSVKL